MAWSAMATFGLAETSPLAVAHFSCAEAPTHHLRYFMLAAGSGALASEQSGPLSKIIEVLGSAGLTFGITKKP